MVQLPSRLGLWHLRHRLDYMPRQCGLRLPRYGRHGVC
nr:MAG TPA: hypothetical protein [Caudoviricetes sp.]